jgi:hypothetical protein
MRAIIKSLAIFAFIQIFVSLHVDGQSCSVSIAGPSDICASQSNFTLTATPSLCATPILFTWKDATNNTVISSGSGITSVTIPTPAAGQYSYTLQITDANNATATASFQVTVHPVPSAGAAVVSEAVHQTDIPNWVSLINICCGTGWKLDLAPPIVGSVQWQVSTNNGTTFSNVPGTTGASNINVNPNSALCNAQQPIQYRAVVSNPPCNDYVSNIVTVNISPPSQIGNVTAGPSTICNDTTSTSLINLSGSAVGTVTWYQNPGCTSSGWTQFTPSSVPFHVGPLSQNTCYKAVAKSGACPAVESSTTVVVDQKPVVGLLAAAPSAICPGETSVLTLTGYTGLIQWYASTNIFNLFAASNAIGGATNNSMQNTNILHTPGYYFYGVTVSSPNGLCQSVTAGLGVLVKPLPTPPTITGPNPNYICAGGSATLTAPPLPAGSTYQWYCNGAPCPGGQTLTVTEPGNYWVEINNGCGTAQSNTLTIKPDLLTVKISGGKCCIHNGQNVTLCAVATNGLPLYHYQWSGGSTATTSCITVHPNATTTYTVTATDNAGCQVSTSFIVTVCH